MKYLHLLFITMVSLPAYGASTFIFSDDTFSLKNLYDSTGTGPATGLAWGIVVDTSGDNFSSALASSAGLKVEDGANFGSGYIFYYGNTTQSIPDLGIVNEPGDGIAIQTRSMNLVYGSGENEITQGDKFAVIWFDSNLDLGDSLPAGSKYGLVQNAGYTMPENNVNGRSFAQFSDDVDPNRPTNLTLVPEPGTALLAFLGLAGFLRRKR